jgi:hypothetical protein
MPRPSRRPIESLTDAHAEIHTRAANAGGLVAAADRERHSIIAALLVEAFVEAFHRCEAGLALPPSHKRRHPRAAAPDIRLTAHRERDVARDRRVPREHDGQRNEIVAEEEQRHRSKV